MAHLPLATSGGIWRIDEHTGLPVLVDPPTDHHPAPPANPAAHPAPVLPVPASEETHP